MDLFKKSLISNKNMIHKRIRLLLSLIAFGIMLYAFGNQSSFLDSDEYITMSSQVSGGYPLFLFAIRQVFGEDNYLNYVSLLQNCLAAFAVWFLAEEIFKGFYPQMIKYVGELIVFAPFVGTYFMSNNNVVLTCSVLTEGLSYPLFYITVGIMIKVLRSPKNIEYTACGVTGGVMILVRPQLAISFAVIAFACARSAMEMKKLKMALIEIVIAVGVILSGSLFYSSIRQGGENILNSGTALTNLICISDSTDSALFYDEEAEIFRRIWIKAKENHYLLEGQEINPLERAITIEKVHDKLKTDVIFSCMYDFAINEKGIIGDIEQSIALKKWINDLRAKLFWSHLPGYIWNWIGLGIVGLIRSNAMFTPALSIISIALYAIYIFLLHKVKERDKHTYIVAHIVLALIVTNAFGVATIIMCISRYMVYNLPLFYCSMLCLLYSLVGKEGENGQNCNSNTLLQ